MNEPLPPSPGDEGYRPISGLALGGFIVSVVFAGLVLVSAAVALFKGAPIFYPMWVLLLAVVGFGLCFAGLTRIRAAEGTRAGESLARYGVGLALFSGLGY